MPTTVYHSSDAGAPSLSNVAGSLVTILDACLVTGYGAKPGAGWTIEYTGTNQRSYKQPVGTLGYYLNVSDTNTTFAEVRGYETMTAFNTGSGAFPNAGVVPTYTWAKASAASCPWTVVANERGFYWWTAYTPTDVVNYSSAVLNYFVELDPYGPSDVWCMEISGANNNSAPQAGNTSICGTSTIRDTSATGKYCSRTYGGGGGAVGMNTLIVPSVWGSSNVFGSTGNPTTALTYPNGPDNGLYMMPHIAVEQNALGTLRGTVRGMWAPMHSAPLAHGDTFSGTGTLAGRTFLALRANSQTSGITSTSSSTTGQVFIETSDTW